MKTIITTIIILVSITLIVACTSQSQDITEVVVLHDITDEHLSQPNVDEIFALFTLENKWNGCIFRFANLTKVSINQEIAVKLEARNEWLSNELDRDKEIKNFKNKILEIIANTEKNAVGEDNSSVYIPIARELNRLHESNANKKILLIYSDLMENTTEMSLYKKEKLNLLKTNPDSVSKYFETQMSLKNLNGITIYIIFQPSDIEEDQQFKIVSGFYKNLFKSKGAEVQITANIN